MTNILPDDAERMAAPLPLTTGTEADIIAGAWAEYKRMGDREALFSTLASVYEMDE